jgi:hypothetical protein
MCQCGRGGHEVLLTIRDAAVILAPSHFGRVSRDVRTGDMMMNSDFGTPDA